MSYECDWYKYDGRNHHFKDDYAWMHWGSHTLQGTSQMFNMFTFNAEQ